MIVDASAILAVLFDEPEAETFLDALESSARKRVSAVNYVEAAIRITSMPDGDVGDLDAFLDAASIDIAPVTPGQARLARDAHRRFGRGRHPAGLNLGDCFAYALAAEAGEALLYKGADFARTDLKAAL